MSAPPGARQSQGVAHEHRRPDDHVPRARGPALPAAPGLRGAGQRHGRSSTTRAAADPEAFWLGQANGAARPGRPSPPRACDQLEPALLHVVRGRHAERERQLPRPPPGRRAATRSPSTGRASRTSGWTITYRDLHERVCRLANGLRARGVGKGDRVAIYLGMVPEIVVAMLACARIGAPHTVIFGGFSPDSVRDRVLDCGVTAMITGDGAWRGGKLVPLKANVDAALEGAPDVHTCVVVRRTEQRDRLGRGPRRSGTTSWSPRSRPSASPRWSAPSTRSTSSTPRARTGKPKGILHTTGGYLTGVAATHRWVFDLKDDDVYWCAADVGWVTGHSYIVYGPARQRRDQRALRGRPGHPRQGPLVGDHRALRGDDPLLRADGDPHLHEVGRRVPRGATTSPRCACSARWASRSTPRPGSGTATPSAAAPARSWTPGGRPRPATS